MRNFSPIPENRFNLQQGALLLAPPAEASSGARENAREFLQALGGDVETYIVLLGTRPTGLLLGMPLGKDRLFEPVFTPSWSVEQLCQEIEAGIWQVADSKHPEYVGEVQRRLRLGLPSKDIRPELWL